MRVWWFCLEGFVWFDMRVLLVLPLEFCWFCHESLVVLS